VKNLGDRDHLKTRSIWEDDIKMDLQAHTHDFRTTKWKKLTTEEHNGL